MKYASLEGADFSQPIGKIVCIGRNYVEHIRELGNETPQSPVLFIKPATSVVHDGGQVVIPGYSSDCHHEAELALLIGKEGSGIAPEDVMAYIAGFGVAIDLTLRDVQAGLKQKGLPWEIAKGFDTACPLSGFTAAEKVTDPHNLRIRLWVNDELRQDASTSLMIHRIPEMVSYMSGIFTLEAGDIILTGTPAGVGPLFSGDRVTAEVDQVGRVSVYVA